MSSIPTHEIPRRSLRFGLRRFVSPLLGTAAHARVRERAERLDLGGTVRVMSAVSRRDGVPPLLTVAVALAETGLRNLDQPGNPARGWFQLNLESGPYESASRRPSVVDAHDLRYSTTEFCREARRLGELHPGLQRNLWLWAAATQGVAGELGRNRPYAARNFGTYLLEAAGFLEAFDPEGLEPLGDPRGLAAEHP